LSGQRLQDNPNSTQLASATISGRQWARDKPPRSSSNRAAPRSDRPILGPGPTRYSSCRCGDRLISTRRWRRPRLGRSGGHCRLMAHDKVGRIVRLKACRIIIGGLIATHRGRIFDLYAGRPASATPGCDRQRQRRGVGMLGSRTRKVRRDQEPTPRGCRAPPAKPIDAMGRAAMEWQLRRCI